MRELRILQFVLVAIFRYLAQFLIVVPLLVQAHFMAHVCHLHRQIIERDLAVVALLRQLNDQSRRLLIIELNVLEFGLALVHLLPRLLDFRL